MCMIDMADGYWRIYSQRIVIARKPRKCAECSREIFTNERYERVDGLLEDGYAPAKWEHYATCEHCVAAKEWLDVQCGGYLFYGVYEDLKEHWEEEHLLRSLWLGRALVGICNKWRKKDGSLMDVLDKPPEIATVA